LAVFLVPALVPTLRYKPIGEGTAGDEVPIETQQTPRLFPRRDNPKTAFWIDSCDIGHNNVTYITDRRTGDL